MRLNQLFYNGPKEIVKLPKEHKNGNIIFLDSRYMSENEIYNVVVIFSGRHLKDTGFKKGLKN